MKTFLAATCVAAAVAGFSEAATLTIDVAEAGGNVVFSGSGSLDLAGLTALTTGALVYPTTSGSNATGFSGAAPALFMAPPPLADTYSLSSTPFAALTSTATPFVVTGQVFGLAEGGSATESILTVPTLYTPGDAITFTWVAENTSVADLGINFGTLASFGGDTIEVTSGTLNTGNTGDMNRVPLPASGVLFLAALAGLAGWHRRALP